MNTIKPPEIAIRVYTAILNQTGTNAPVATILHNTLKGTVTWTRNNTGYYIGTLTDDLINDKTALFINRNTTNKNLTAGIDTAPNTIFVRQTAYNSPFVAGDEISGAIIEIRLYN